MTALAGEFHRISLLARLAECLLMDAAVAREIAGREGLACVVWVKDPPPEGARVGGGVYMGEQGDLALLPAAAAEELDRGGYVAVREPLRFTPAERPEIAKQLRELAAELERVAASLT